MTILILTIWTVVTNPTIQKTDIYNQNTSIQIIETNSPEECGELSRNLVNTIAKQRGVTKVTAQCR